MNRIVELLIFLNKKLKLIATIKKNTKNIYQDDCNDSLTAITILVIRGNSAPISSNMETNWGTMVSIKNIETTIVKKAKLMDMPL